MLKTDFPPPGAWKATIKHKIGLAKAHAIRYISQLAWRNDLKVSRKTFALKVEQWTTKIWSNEWQSQLEQNYKQTGHWFPQGPRPEVSRSLLSKDRDSIGKFIQFFTGHGWLRYAQHKRGEKQSARCRLCNNEDETPWHLWTTCQGTKQARLRCQIFNNLWTLGRVDRFLGTNTMVKLLDVNEEE